MARRQRWKTDLKGKVAVVTGAAGAMGRAVMQALAREGARTVGIDLKPGRGIVICDIADPEAAARAMREIGRVDILVNNAGILSNNKSQATTPAEWRQVLAANLDGAFHLSRAAIPGMKRRRWGRIINTCSLAAKTGGLTAGTAYSTSKGALTSLTFSLARELAPFGVTVNGISPAYVRTPMVTRQLNAAQRRAVLAQIPVGRFCEPEEFAHVVRFLASPLSGFITGEIVDLNGGVIMD